MQTGVTHLRAAMKMAQKAQCGYLTVVAVWTDQKRKAHQKKKKHKKKNPSILKVKTCSAHLQCCQSAL